MATDKKISELDLAISLTATDLVPITDSNGENKSIHGQQIKDFVGDEFSDDIQAVEDMISDSYDDLTFPVAAGTLCINDNKLYKANQDISTSETFDPLKWDQTTIAAVLNSFDILIKKYVGPLTTISADTYANCDTGYVSSPTGYTLLGVVAADPGNTQLVIENFKADSMRIRNMTGSNRDAQATVQLLFVKYGNIHIEN